MPTQRCVQITFGLRGVARHTVSHAFRTRRRTHKKNRAGGNPNTLAHTTIYRCTNCSVCLILFRPHKYVARAGAHQVFRCVRWLICVRRGSSRKWSPIARATECVEGILNAASLPTNAPRNRRREWPCCCGVEFLQPPSVWVNEKSFKNETHSVCNVCQCMELYICTTI